MKKTPHGVKGGGGGGPGVFKCSWEGSKVWFETKEIVGGEKKKVLVPQKPEKNRQKRMNTKGVFLGKPQTGKRVGDCPPRVVIGRTGVQQGNWGKRSRSRKGFGFISNNQG